MRIIPLLVFTAIAGFSISLNAQNEKAIEAYNQGITFFNTKNLKGAINSFNDAISIDSTLNQAYFNRAVAKAEQNDFSGAISDYSMFINRDKSGSDRAHFSRAQAYYLMQKRDEALADYLEAGRRNPENYDAHYYAGGIHFEKGAYSDAIRLFTQAITAKNDFAEAYHDRASAKQKSGDTQGAIADYREATKLRPNLVQAYNNLGTLLRISGDLQGALVEFGYSIKADPKQSQSYVKRGRVKFDMQDFDGAMADFNKAIELNARDAFAYNNRGCLKNKLRDFQGAIEDFDKALSLDPNYGYAYMNRGISRENLNDVAGACKDWNEATLNGVEIAKQFIDSDCN